MNLSTAKQQFIEEFAPCGFIEDDEEFVVPKMLDFLTQTFQQISDDLPVNERKPRLENECSQCSYCKCDAEWCSCDGYNNHVREIKTFITQLME